MTQSSTHRLEKIALSEMGNMLAEMTERLLAELFDDAAIRAARDGAWPQAAWDRLVGQGLHLALVEGEQGFGLPLGDGLALVGLTGRRAIPLPLGETMIANALLARAGLPVSDAPVALVPAGGPVSVRRENGAWRATGVAERIAWGRNATTLVIEMEGGIAAMTADFDLVEAGSNLAGMPRDRIAIDGEVTVAPLDDLSVIEAGALVRALAMAGALETLVELTLAHICERKQFGRSLSAFQAVQHSLAQLAEEAAAAAAAAGLAANAFAAASPRTGVAIAAARARIGEASEIAIGIAHQLHGAIGFTREHRLHWFTTALWGWRDEFGSAGWWTRRLGAAALSNDKRAFWPFVTSV